MNTSNKENTKIVRIKRPSSTVEIKLGSSRRSLSGKLSARPVKSLFRAKSLKKASMFTVARQQTETTLIDKA